MINNDANLIIEPDEINQIGGLWLGNLKSAQNKSFLIANNIKSVLTVAIGQPVSYYNLNIIHKQYPIEDNPDFILLAYFDKLNKLIDKYLKLGSVLVHCAAGISRSASVIIAYIIYQNQYGFQQSYDYVKQKRASIKPNNGFIIQLQKFQLICETKSLQKMNSSQQKYQKKHEKANH